MRGNAWGFGFDPGSWFWGPGMRRGRRGQWFESGDMKYVILKLLRDKPMHGYEVMKALEEETKGCYKPSPGTVYPTLQWLEDEGLVKASTVDEKKVYAITDLGRQFLETNKGTVSDIFDRVSSAIDQLVSEPMTDITRAASKLVAVSYRAAMRSGMDAETKKKIPEILDRAAKEIEALIN